MPQWWTIKIKNIKITKVSLPLGGLNIKEITSDCVPAATLPLSLSQVKKFYLSSFGITISYVTAFSNLESL